MSDRREVSGGVHVANGRGNVVAGNTIVASGGARFAGGGRPNGAPPGGGYPGGRPPLPPPPPPPFPVYNGAGPGWDVGSAVVGGLVVGATAGLVSGAIASNAARPVVVVEPPPYPYPPEYAPVDQVALTAGARTAARSPRPSTSAAAPTPPRGPTTTAESAAAPAVAPAPVEPLPSPTPGAPEGTRFAYGTRFVQLPEDCQAIQRGPIAFEQCRVDWLQPVMQGGTVFYVAVPPPG